MAEIQIIPSLFDPSPLAKGEPIPGATRTLNRPYDGMAWTHVDLNLKAPDLPHANGTERFVKLALGRLEAAELIGMWAGYLTERAGTENDRDKRTPSQKLRDLANLLDPPARPRARPKPQGDA